jgi:hypothetical protein
MPDTDLFGNPVSAPTDTRPDRPPVNDMAMVETVLRTAIQDGYALIGRRERVWLAHSNGHGRLDIEPVTDEINTTVHQLIDAKWLTVGGFHQYYRGARLGPGRSVLVPRDTRQRVARWRNLHRPANWKPSPRKEKTA